MTLERFKARAGFDASSSRSTKLGDPLEWNDPVGRQDFVPRDWILERANYTALAGRVGDLPVSTPAAPIRDGTTCLIKYLYNGEQLSRLAVWDSTKTQVGGIGHITADVDPADVANIITNANSQFPGEEFIVGSNKSAEFEVTYNANGTLGITITKPGSGYRLGEVYDHNGLANLTNGVHFIVDRLVGPSPTGGWRYVDIESWVKPLVADADVATDQQEGDFQSTTETGHKELKIWHNNAWITLFSEDTIKGWIAALSLFEGTVEPEDGTSAGAVKFDALPDLQLLTASNDRTKNSHYWTYVGAPNFVVHSEYVATGLTGGVAGVYRWSDGAGSEFILRDVDGTHAAVSVATLDAAVTNGQVFTVPAGQVGTGSSGFTFTVPDIAKPGTPMIGADLDGAILNPGDWVQIADRGTGGTVDLHWVTVGGDLLAKARGDKLFGLQNWVDGGWEKGSLVVHQNTIYRAKQGVIGGDAAPGAITGSPQINSVALTGPIVDGTNYIITIDGNPASYTTTPGDTPATVAQALINKVNTTAATARLMQAGIDPAFTPTATQSQIQLTGQTNGQSYTVTVLPLAGTPGDPNTLLAQQTQAAAAPTANNWEKVDLSGGVRWVMTDGDLPSQAPAGELYFILASPQYGGGAGALVYFDAGANKWMPLGGAGGQPLDLSGGLVVYERVIYWDGTGTKPDGIIHGDILFVGAPGSSGAYIQRWDLATSTWVTINYGPKFGDPADADKIIYYDSNGYPKVSTRTFKEELKLQIPEVLSVQKPASHAPGGNANNITSLVWTPLKSDGGMTYRQIRYVDGITDWVLYFRAPNHVAGDQLTVNENWQLTVGNGLYNKLDKAIKWNWDTGGKYFFHKISHWDDNNRQKSGSMAHAVLDITQMGNNMHIFYRMEWTRIDGHFASSKGELFISGQTGSKKFTGFDLNAFNSDGLKYYDVF